MCLINGEILDNSNSGVPMDPKMTVSTNVNVAAQEILTLAEEADPASDRRLGILTKAHLVTERTAKLAVVNLVKGNRKPLKLGYHVITNRGGGDHGEMGNAFAALQEREVIFQEHP
ncbi:hypothetical protein LX36DRAFT_712381 [Colletotrichum falcatum]|nr:hypothetical protein LX36DRAFT_712381 [Colletotrichum falcatum]